MYFPTVPNVPGVPGVPRIPPGIINLVGSSLDQASDLLAEIGLSARNSPLSAMSGFLPDMTVVSDYVGIASSTMGNYPSSLFSPFVYPMTDVSASVAGIINNINLDPSGAIGSIQGSLDDAFGQIGDVSDNFASAEGIDNISLDGVESVTSSAVRGAPQWGLFEEGKSQIEADNVIGFEYRQDWVVADFPLEDGAFESYDKVETPFDARIQFSCGGSLEARTGFLASIAAIAGNLKLYDAVTPVKTYSSVNVVHFDYKQTAQNGVGLMVVDVFLEQIRNTAEASFSTASSSDEPPTPTKTPAPKAASAAPQKNGGTKQPQAIKKSDQSSYATALLNTLL